MPVWLGAVFEFGVKLLGYLKGRQDLANQPELKKAKQQQIEQDQVDEMSRLMWVAKFDPDSKKRQEAFDEIQRRESE